jgi:uncharacterized protein (TIRG00374 family)
VETSSNSITDSKEFSLRQAFDKKTLILLGSAFLLFLFFLISENVSFQDFIDIIGRMNLIILIIGAGFTFIAVLIDSVAWKFLLRISSINPSIASVYRIQLASFSFGLLIPSAGAIEIIMRIALGRKEFVHEEKRRHATSGEILSSVVVHRLCGLLAFIPIAIFLSFAMFSYLSDMLANLPGGQPLPEDFGIFFVTSISIISLIIVAFFSLIAISSNTAKKIVLILLKGLSVLPYIDSFAKKAMEPYEKIIENFSNQFKYLAQNKLLSFLVFLLTFFSQIAHWISIYFILHSIQIPILIDQVAAVNFLSGTADLIPVGIPGMAGIKEITLKFFLQFGLKLEDKLAWSGSILVQLIKVYFLVFVGILVYLIGKTRLTIQDLEDKVS